MTWNRKSYDDIFAGFYHVRKLKLGYVESLWHRFKICRHVFTYDITDRPLIEDNRVLFETATMNGYPIMEWLESHAKGKVKVEFAHTVSPSLCRLDMIRGWEPRFVLRMKVSFSDKDLAMMWKLTWGGGN